MNAQRKLEIKVGLVSITAILLFIIGMTLGRGVSVSASKTIYLRFPSSGGIQNTAPVVVNGVKRGSVVSVKNQNGSVLITADIDDISDLKSDVTAKIVMLEITGGKKIEITPGKSQEQFDINKEISGVNASDIGDLLTMLGEVGTDAHLLVKRLDTISASISYMLADGKLVNKLNQTLDNVNEISVSTKNLLTNNTSDLNVTLKNLKELTNSLKITYNKTEPKIDTLLQKLDNTLNDVGILIDVADTTLNNADYLIGDLRGLTYRIQNGDGFATKLLFDKELSMKLDSTFITLKLLVEQIKEYGINANVRLGSRP